MQKPRISLIAAMTKNYVIGKDNQMPWHLPGDLAHFKALTVGKPIIMGRKTFESIGKALPKRPNIVITRNSDVVANDCHLVGSLEEALELARRLLAPKEDEIMVIGGTQIFKQAFPLADRMYLTFIDAELEGDCFFPEWDEAQWHTIESKTCEADEKNAYAREHVTMERRT